MVILAVLLGILTVFSCFALLDTLFKLIPFLSAQVYLPVIETDVPVLTLIVVDVCLLVIFMVQHSFMSSKGFKKKTISFLGAGQRSLYVLFTCLALQFLMRMWQPIRDWIIWSYDTSDSPMISLFFCLVHSFAWCMLFLENIFMEPLFLIGIKQIYYSVRGYGLPSVHSNKQLMTLLDHFSHPGTGCFLLILWIHPFMRLDRWILATVLTWYLCLRSRVTEKDYQYTEEHIFMKRVQVMRTGRQYVTASSDSSD